MTLRISSGIVLLDKPLGLSSNAALQRVRKLFGRVKAGHTGSLDPLATGMLPICLGEATKIAGELLAERKCYRFNLRLGSRTATGDTEGEVIETLPVPALDEQAVTRAAQDLIGPRMQVPPMYSALKRNGEPLYALARRGEEVERAARPIEIVQLQLLGIGPADLHLRVLCSKGTYVRTLAEELAARLGTCAHLVSLRREFVEPFEGVRMWTLEELEDRTQAALQEAVLAADLALPHLEAVALHADAAARVRQGQAVGGQAAAVLLEGAAALHPGRVRLYDEHGRFMGLGELDETLLLRPRRLFLLPEQAGLGL